MKNSGLEFSLTLCSAWYLFHETLFSGGISGVALSHAWIDYLRSYSSFIVGNVVSLSMPFITDLTSSGHTSWFSNFPRRFFVASLPSFWVYWALLKTPNALPCLLIPLATEKKPIPTGFHFTKRLFYFQRTINTWGAETINWPHRWGSQDLSTGPCSLNSLQLKLVGCLKTCLISSSFKHFKLLVPIYFSKTYIRLISSINSATTVEWNNQHVWDISSKFLGSLHFFTQIIGPMAALWFQWSNCLEKTWFKPSEADNLPFLMMSHPNKGWFHFSRLSLC